MLVTDVEEDRFRDLKNNMTLKHLILDENPLGVDVVHKYVLHNMIVLTVYIISWTFSRQFLVG